MNNLSEELLTLIGKLHNVQNKKINLQQRIQSLEQKLTMTREANSALTNEEQELVNTLQSHGIHYGHHFPQANAAQTAPMIQPDQLTSLLSSLFSQHYGAAMSPTSLGMNGMYGFPQAGKPLIPPGAISGISPTSGPMPMATPGPMGMVPTSAPNMYGRN